MGLRETLRFITTHPLTADRPVDALRRFAAFQVASRLSGTPLVVGFAGDARLLVGRGMRGATGNVYVGLHEFEDMALVLHLLRPEDLFVDVGANVGSYTVLAGKVAGASCVSLEPVPDTYAHLLDNLRLNGIEGRVDARCVGASDAEEELEFTAGLDVINHVATPEERGRGDVVRVPVIPLDAVLAGRVPTAIKIDVEGFESRVLGGAARTLAAPGLQCVIMETNDSGARYGVGDGALHAIMADHGFSRHRYDPRSRTLDTDPSAPGRGNSVFIRDTAWARARVQSAPRVRVLGQAI